MSSERVALHMSSSLLMLSISVRMILAGPELLPVQPSRCSWYSAPRGSRMPRTTSIMHWRIHWHKLRFIAGAAEPAVRYAAAPGRMAPHSPVASCNRAYSHESHPLLHLSLSSSRCSRPRRACGFVEVIAVRFGGTRDFIADGGAMAGASLF